MVGNSNAADHIQARLYEAIVQQILSGELPPGHRLVEEDLARRLKVSRTPVREVLFALQNDGLVERARNRGARVAVFTADDVEELFEIRKALECSCIPKVVRTMKLNELLVLERRLRSLSSKKNAALVAEQADIDTGLHRFIIAQSGNRRLIRLMGNLSLLLHSLRMAGYRLGTHAVDRAAEEHQRIVRALLRRDVELTQRLLAEHIERGKQNTIELLIQAGRHEAIPSLAAGDRRN